MIKIEEPALALNDIRVGGHIRLSRNLRIRKDDQRESIVGSIQSIALGTPGGRLRSLVLNSHGVPGYLIMGEGFWKPHTGIFQGIAGMVSTIWLTACRIASRTPLGPDQSLPQELPGAVGDGYDFCREIAVRSGANVVASLNDQDVPNRRIPAGHIDAYEGMLLCFRSTGDLAWARKYALNNGE